MKRLTLIATACAVAWIGMSVRGGSMEVKDKKVAWAHYVPWHNPLISSFSIQKYYNFPWLESTGDQLTDYRNEFKAAMAQGVDGFFADVVAKKNASPAFASQLPIMLKAAEGTPFLVAPCLDVKTTVEQQIRDLKTILDQCAAHPNYPHCNGRPIIMTYTWSAWTPEEWKAIRTGLKAQGHDIYLIANLSTGFKKKTPEMFEPYGEVFDMAYSFGESGINRQTVKENNDIMAGVARKHGKDWMPTLWPGYYGAWLNGRNDFYQPHRGFDQLHEGFLAIDPARAGWLHLTTWNDHDETSLLPMPFTFGNPEITRAYIDAWRGVPSAAAEPKVMMAYHREEIPGTLLRLEAMTLPVRSGEKISVSGRLLGADGKTMAELPIRKLSTKDFDRCEWLVPTVALAVSPFLIPELTVTGKNYRRQALLPAIFFKSGWLQNAVTVKVPVHAMAEVTSQWHLSQQGNLIAAGVEFKSAEPIRHLTLWRNDRPLAEFSPVTDGKTLLNLMITPEKNANFKVKVTDGTLLAVLRAFHSGKDPNFMASADSFEAQKSAPWNTVGAVVEVKPATRMTIAVARNEPVVLRPEELVERQSVAVGGIRLRLSPVDPCLMNSPALNRGEGRYTLKLLSRAALPDDTFYLRFETVSGRVGFSRILMPFTNGKPVRMNLVETSVNLETSSGASGMPGRSEYLSAKVPLRTPVLTSVPVHPVVLRQGRWTFERGGADELGEMPLLMPRYLKPEMVVDGGVNGGKCLRFNGKDKVEMRKRTYPLGAATLDFFIKPDAGRNSDQVLIGRAGWSAGMDVFLLRDGRIKVVRNGGRLTPVCSLEGHIPVAPGKWSRIRIIFDEKNLRLYVDGRPDGEVTTGIGREYGNCSWFLGGGIKNVAGYTGLLDDLTVLSRPVAPGEQGFPPQDEHAPLKPLRLASEVEMVPVNSFVAVWDDFQRFKAVAHDPASAIPATQPFAPAKVMTGHHGAIAFLLGPGGSCRGGSCRIKDFSLRDGQQIVLPVKRFEIAGDKASGWTALEICLKNRQGDSYNFNLGSPVHGGISSVMAGKWQYRGGNFKYRCPERFIIRKMDGQIVFLVGSRKVYAVKDDPQTPFESVVIAPVIQKSSDAVAIEFGAPELFRLSER